MADEASATLRGSSLPIKTLVGLALGVACGLFFGESCGWLQVVADAFVGLLQMTVLPYISISLITSVGRLTPQLARRLGGRVGLLILFFWAIGLLTVLVTSAAFPTQQQAAFYSSSLLETPASLNFLDLFIPTNPFRSMANNWIPAVVLFCVSMGFSVMALPNKQPFLDRLDEWLDVLKRLNGYVVLLTPYGVFAIVAAAAGTMTIDEMTRIQAYLLAYTIAVVFLAFLLLPAFVASCTPFGYRDILDVTLQAMITAFATEKLIVVLPLLVAKTQELFEKYGLSDQEVRTHVEVIYPLIYPIPNLGKLLSLIFVPFAAWFVGSSLELADYPALLALGSIAYFGRPLIAIPFLLDVFRLPADMFQLFVASGVYCGRIGDVLAVMHVFTVTTLGTCAIKGHFRIRFVELAIRVGLSCGVAAIGLMGLHSWLARASSAGPSKEAVVAKRQLLRNPSPAVVRDGPLKDVAPVPDNKSHLDIIRESRVIRFGFLKDRLPYSYFNEQGELVGHDIDLAHMLAQELQCKLVFVPFELHELAQDLEANQFDAALSGLAITTSTLLGVRYSQPYLDVSVSFVVRDHRRRDFATTDSIRELESLTIAVPRDDYFRNKVKELFPNAQFVVVDRSQEFFESSGQQADALLIDAESGSAWTFLYPEFRPVVPSDLRVKLPLAIAVERHDQAFADFLSRWIELKQRNGELDELYDYWILGRTKSDRAPRWSILRNVLGVGKE